ncbi:cell division protein SepF [Anaerobium acetethylicum]|uniref:Cell division protein SepF n=1 Tax=Anaerobium acetethylicum TaxID=1619234 RepID=A0A1D3TNW2_9FIRM|nr:cell division protein SepF [Anaerobium acetethylicum]SCP95027.1 cell division inhibitor SepF [Anaerobium acetethylicum]
MSMFNKFMDLMRLNGDEVYDDDDDFMDEPATKSFVNKAKAEDKSYDDYGRDDFKTKAAQSKNGKITPIRPSRKQINGMEVCVIKPANVEDSREITETLLSGRTVVLNLEGIEVDVAQRIIDFTSGSCFAISGNLQKISNYIFIITPSTVDISGDFQSILNGAFDVPALQTEF